MLKPARNILPKNLIQNELWFDCGQDRAPWTWHHTRIEPINNWRVNPSQSSPLTLGKSTQKMWKTNQVVTGGLEICCFSFLKISQFLERILMEHKDIKNSLDSKLQVYSICSIRINSRKWDIFEKSQQLTSNPSV